MCRVWRRRLDEQTLAQVEWVRRDSIASFEIP